MKERPLIFSGPMVQAILDGKKTQTRRVIKPQPESKIDALGKARDAVLRSGGNVYFCDHSDTSAHDTPYTLATCPYGQPGDLLWVRETWAENPGKMYHDDPEVVYKTDFDGFYSTLEPWGKWKPSIHMPRWASRITLAITKIRVERLNDISEADTLAEGIVPDNDNFAAGGTWRNGRSVYQELWESLHGKGSWFSNPWVWVIEFEVVKK